MGGKFDLATLDVITGRGWCFEAKTSKCAIVTWPSPNVFQDQRPDQVWDLPFEN